MAEQSDDAPKGTGRTALAEDRTDLAEDRTLLANERTFGGWARTALASIGIGVGFNALFRTLEPEWVPKALATLFIVLGMVVIIMAERRACRIAQRLEAHEITSLPSLNLRLIAIIFCLGAGSLIAGIWVLA